MRQRSDWHTAMWLLVFSGMLLGTVAWAQPAADGKAATPAPTAATPAAAPTAADPAPTKAISPAKANASHGRMPPYFSQVTDEKQRQAVYQIQAAYHDRITALKAQLDALTKERDDKVAAVLTTEQHKRIEELKAAAKEKRTAKQEEN